MLLFTFDTYPPLQAASKNPIGILVIDTKSTKSDLGQWKIITANDSTYVQNATNKKHLEFTVRKFHCTFAL